MTADADYRPATGSADNLREIAHEQLWLTGHHTSMAVDQFAVRADAGGYYNTRRAAAHLRMAIDTLKLLRECLEREATEAAARRPDGPLSGAERRGERA